MGANADAALNTDRFAVPKQDPSQFAGRFFAKMNSESHAGGFEKRGIVKLIS